jgi:hypothetical protein
LYILTNSTFSSKSSVHLLRGLSTVPFQLLQFLLAFLSFAFCHHHHTILEGIYKLYTTSPKSHILYLLACSYFPAFSFLY